MTQIKSGLLGPVALFLLAAVWAVMTLKGFFTPIDEAVALGVRSADGVLGAESVKLLLIGITHVGDSVTLIILSLLAVGYCAVKKSYADAVSVLILVLVAFLLTPLLKVAFGRPRPDLVEHLVHASSPSFPSGHALRSSVVYIGLLLLLKNHIAFLQGRFIGTAVICLVFLIGFSRVFLGVHWPTDIVFAWLLAAGWLGLWSTLRLKNHR